MNYSNGWLHGSLASAFTAVASSASLVLSGELAGPEAVVGTTAIAGLLMGSVATMGMALKTMKKDAEGQGSDKGPDDDIRDYISSLAASLAIAVACVAAGAKIANNAVEVKASPVPAASVPVLKR